VSTVQTGLEVVTEEILSMQAASVNNMLNGVAKITSFDADVGSVVFCRVRSFFMRFGVLVAMLKHSCAKETVAAGKTSAEVPGLHAANEAAAL